MTAKLSETDRAKALKKLPLWKEAAGRDAITRKFVFADFNQAFGFMTRAAMKIEKLDHHPEWFNLHRLVEVTLTTHDCRGVSEKDIALATLLDEAAT